MDSIFNLSIIQMVSAYIFVLIVLAIIRIRGISREKELIISTVRMTLQLTLTGYILVYVFKNSNPFVTILIVAFMEVFAIYNVYNRTKFKLSSKLKKIIAISMAFGTLASLLYFLLVVVQISPWYNPRYFIPIAGMIIGNSMTAIALSVNGLVDGINARKNLIESALMLGATPKMATKEIVDNTFDSAILPTINSMVGMGIVFLPGMMTGQILSGTSPVTAIHYQIATMLGILGSVSLTVILFVHLGYKTFFNQESQLIVEEM